MVKNTSTPNTSTIVLPKRTKTGKVIKRKGKKTLYPYDVGITTLISDKALKDGYSQHTLEALKDRVLSSFYRYFIINGSKPLEISNEARRDESFRVTEYMGVVTAIDDDSITATLLKVNEENNRAATALLGVNDLSLLQLIKRRLFRKKLVDIKYHVSKTILDA